LDDVPNVIGRYEIRRMISGGALERVYLAFDPVAERQTALKVFCLQGCHPRLREQFLASARAHGTIHHPNVCPLYDVGFDGELTYQAMPFFPLGNLRDLLEKHGRRLPVPNAISLAREIALGMSAAHEQRVFHLDIKPNNVLLGTLQGEAVVTDFMRYGPLEDHGDGDTFGTPAYMSPEQCMGRVHELGSHSDIYGLGVVLYEMLTGRLPFSSMQRLLDLFRDHCETPPVPPSQLRDGLDPQLVAVCLKCLEKKPKNRYQSAKELADALAGVGMCRSTATSADERADRFGRFEVRKVLGNGAFGRVLLAYDPITRREVAIKHPFGNGLSPSAIKRFRKEAWAAARLTHPNVCPVYEAEVETPTPYIVMRYVSGGTLADILRRCNGSLKPQTALKVAGKLALGLAAAHAVGLIHRDLKPANVLYDRAQREVLIADFGLAYVLDLVTESRGEGKGTPAYMAPEQWDADRFGPITPQSDVYSLGVILYQMLTGKQLFTGPIAAQGYNHCHTLATPPSVTRPELGTKYDAV
jgi:serine/threonine-protein kinase